MMEEFVEEHMGEGGLLEDALNDKGKVTKAGVKAQLRAIQDDDEPESEEERRMPSRAVSLSSTPSRRRARPSETPRLRWTSGCYRVTPRSPRPRSRRWL